MDGLQPCAFGQERGRLVGDAIGGAAWGGATGLVGGVGGSGARGRGGLPGGWGGGAGGGGGGGGAWPRGPAGCMRRGWGGGSRGGCVPAAAMTWRDCGARRERLAPAE